MFYKSIVAPLAIILLLSGCQTLPQQEYTPNASQQLRLQNLTNWQAKGKIAVRFDQQGNSAQFHWRQKRQDYRLHLFGPFGVGNTWLIKSGSEISLESAKIDKQTASSAEELMDLNLGWNVPVANLPYWMRGLAAPNLPITAQQLDENGFFTTLQQQGWTIQYSKYQAVKGWWLPAKLIAKRDDIKVIMVIKEWQLPKKPRSLIN